MEKTHYQHLDIFERQKIYYLRHYKSLSLREIARRLNRSHSTISREIKRNSGCWGNFYYHNPAQWAANKRRSQRLRPPLLKTESLRRYVEDRLRAGWTPELIAGRLKTIGAKVTVSHETIYQFIYRERKDLIPYLARKHKKRKKKFRTSSVAVKNSLKTMICDRPEEINQRSVAGHWESDSMESVNHQPGLNVIQERFTRLIHITRLKGKGSKETESAVVFRLINHDPEIVKSITFDNGVENWNFKEIESRLSIESYFCDPYSSWQKGGVEHAIGLVCRFLPKKTDISNVSNKELIRIEKLLNNRPMKCLGYRTPYEMMKLVRNKGGALEF
tara:strand:- start:182 stop:1174 length:993 start_codon:yes stop_codon:yes gene_type:complete